LGPKNGREIRANASSQTNQDARQTNQDARQTNHEARILSDFGDELEAQFRRMQLHNRHRSGHVDGHVDASSRAYPSDFRPAQEQPVGSSPQTTARPLDTTTPSSSAEKEIYESAVVRVKTRLKTVAKRRFPGHPPPSAGQLRFLDSRTRAPPPGVRNIP
jgi:hypothetical protein